MLIHHVRDTKGLIHATLVAVSKDKIGLSLWKQTSHEELVATKQNKHFFIDIAAGRALSNTRSFEYTYIPKRTITPEWSDAQAGGGKLSLAEVVNIEFLRLKERAEKYFK